MKKFFSSILSLILLQWLLCFPVSAGLFSVSDQQVIQAGRKAHQDVMKQYGVWNDPTQQERVNRLGERLAQFSLRPEIQYRFYLLNSDVLNAMATPDGSIHVTKGLLLHFTDDKELSFVLGHEITHVEKRHGKQQIEKSMAAQTGATMLSLIFARNSQLGQVVFSGGAYWLSMKYSRDFETQADEGGMELVKKEGIDPHYGPMALEHLSKLNKEKPNLMQQYFGSHPLDDVRVQHAKEFADSLNSKKSEP